MSSAVNKLVNYATLGLVDLEPEAADYDVEEVDTTEAAESAEDTAKRKAQAASKTETTQTVLTSPLGSTSGAKTSVTKLGG